MSFQPNHRDGEPSELEKNLDHVYKSHQEVIMHFYNIGDFETTRRLCKGATDSFRLPSAYRAAYGELMEKMDAEDAARKFKQEAIVEAITVAKLNALSVANDMEDTLGNEDATGDMDSKNKLAQNGVLSGSVSEGEGGKKDSLEVRSKISRRGSN